MEPNNIDNEFKKRLSDREIQPRAEVWDKLDLLLDESVAFSAKKKKNNWLYMAAGVIGFVFLATVFFTPKNIKVNDPLDKGIVNENLILDSIQINSFKVEDKVEVLNDHLNKTVAEKSKNQKKSNIVYGVSVSNQSVSNQSQIVVISVDSKTNIDSLLKEATTATEDNEILNQNIKVDASSLLSQVDNELEPSFREKVINKVNKNFQTVKVAINNRNVKE